MKLTPEQQRAVDSRASSVIVSAGAGSGKTAVLTQRIISRLSDPAHPADIERFLVVTFTNAAALEMRSRITKALTEKLQESLSDRLLSSHLRRQISKMSIAKVQTVDSFCLDLCRRHFTACSLSPDFAVGDEAQLLEMRNKAVLKVLEDSYENPPEGFDELRRTLCEERGDKRLREEIISLFDKLQSLPRPKLWLGMQTEKLRSDKEKGELDALLQKALAEHLTAADALCKTVREVLSTNYESLWKVYSPTFEYAENFIANAFCALKGEDFLSYLDTFDIPKLQRAPNGSPAAAKDLAKTVRALVSAHIADMKGFFMFPSPTKDTFRAEICLCNLVGAFIEAFALEKRRKNIVDFNDLEHFAIDILSTPEGEPSEVALEMREYLCELMVDEYQDTNEVQDEIYRLIAPKGGTSFFVGDIKQSIYRFRRANPKIFASRCKQAQENSGDCEYIAMDTNFRSRPEVLSLCNRIFSRTMSESLGDVDYLEKGQALQAGRETSGVVPSEVIFIDTVSANNNALESGDDKASAASIEAAAVAEKIRDMVGVAPVPDGDGTRTARYSDFAILLSSFKSKSATFRQALESLGIPCRTESDGKSAFETVEASVIISLLRIIANRRQDIPLMSVLRSPFFSFTAEELARIRGENPNGDLWDAVLSCSQKEGGEKCASFVKELDYYCDLSRDTSCSSLLQHIYARTGAYGVFSALPFPEMRRDTLDMLYSYALKFEGSSFKQVSEFVSFLDMLMVSPTLPALSSGEGVTIISIHKSKGLEYPFVFVCDLGKGFNLEDCHSPVMLHHDIGLGLKSVDTASRVRVPTLKQKLISRQVERELKSEELRKLYVALTRAREKLFLVVSSGRSRLEKYLSTIYDLAGASPDSTWLIAQSSAAMWVIPTLFDHPSFAAAAEYVPSLKVSKDEDDGALKINVVSYNAGSFDEREPDMIESPDEPFYSPLEEQKFRTYLELIDKFYPYAQVSNLPSKVTPSQAQKIMQGEREQKGGIYLGSLAGGDTDMETAAEKGTRIHSYLAGADISLCRTLEGAMSEITRISGNVADEKDAQMLLSFANSDLGLASACAQECLREYQFSVLLTPAQLGLADKSDEHILLNGSIDMLLFTDEGLTVVDFKTDSVIPGKEAFAAEKHRRQLEIYALAAEEIFERKVVKKSVFFLKTGKEAVL